MNQAELINTIAQLSARSREQRDPAIERQLIDLRVQAFNNTVWPANPHPYPPPTR